MKRKLYASVAVMCAFAMLTACGTQKEDTAETETDKQAEEEESEQIANPWADCSLDDLKSYFPGMNFPSSAENVVCRYDESEGIGEADYNISGEDPALDYTLRFKLTDGLEDISGYYYEWTYTDDTEILGYPEEMKSCSDEGKEIQVLNWYDTDTGICYSLSLSSEEDLDGFDIYGRALEMYETGSDDSGDGADAEGKIVSPLPASVDISALSDCTVNVSFTVNDVNIDEKTITADVYDTLLYDAVDVSGLAVGDTIVVDGQDVVIQTLSETDYGITINEALADETMLAPGDGGTYYIMGYDDVIGMTDLGTVTLPLSDDVVLNDCGEMPEDTFTVALDEMEAHFGELSESRQTFDCQSTTLLIENGTVTEINRSWRP